MRRSNVDVNKKRRKRVMEIYGQNKVGMIQFTAFSLKVRNGITILLQAVRMNVTIRTLLERQ